MRIPLPPEPAYQRIADALTDAESDCEGKISRDKIELMARCEHHFWSPELRASLHPDGERTELRGRFSPKPAVWTMFMVIYIHLGFAAISGLVYASAQLTLERSPTALWAVPIALAAALLVYGASRIGQRLGAGEMQQITGFVERVYGVAADTE